jgi:hypothetical protein
METTDLVKQETSFSIYRRKEADKLKPSQAIEEFLQAPQNIDLMTEYWSFDDKKKDFIKNENIVSELSDKLRELAPESKEAKEVFEKVRDFKRRLNFMCFSDREGVDEKTGEVKISKVVRFYDSYSDKMIDMGQAIIVGKFIEIEKMIREQGGTLEGVAFWIEYKGNEKNKKNEFSSDRFKITIAE